MKRFGARDAAALLLSGSILLVGPNAGAEVSLLDMAQRGNAEAQFALGLAYLEGREVAKDPAEVVRWLSAAVRQGHVEARYTLGTLYREGVVVARDYKAAAKLLGKAAEKGHAESQLAVGEMFAAGQGAPRNRKAAADWIEAAAGQGLPKAQARLGEIYYQGKGRAANPAQAYFWLTLAGDAVSPRGREMLASMRQQFPEKQQQKVLRAARAFGAEHSRPLKKPSPLRGVPVVAKAAAPLPGGVDSPEEPAAILSPEDLARLGEAEARLEAALREGDDAGVSEVRDVAEELLARVPAEPRALYLRARAEIGAGRFEAAVRDLRAAIDGRPEWAEALFWLGTSLVHEGEPEEAREALTRSIRLDSGLIEARGALARLDAARGDRESAVMHARLYLEDRPDSEEMRTLMLDSLVALGRAKEALRLLLAIPERDRDAGVYSGLGRVYLALGEAKKARELLTRADAEAPHRAETLRGLLTLDAEENRLQQSVERIEAALKLRPDDARLHRLMGLAALHDGRAPEAEKSFERATTLDPADAESYTQLADLYAEQGRPQEAAEAYERALKAAPAEGSIYLPLAGVYLSLGRRESAIESYEAAIQHAPGNAEARLVLAGILAEGDEAEHARAVELAEGARSLLPGDPQPLLLLGKLHLERGDPGEAVRFLEEAEAALAPGAPERGAVRHQLAQAYEANGDKELARVELERALSELAARAEAEEPPWADDARARLARLNAGPQ